MKRKKNDDIDPTKTKNLFSEDEIDIFKFIFLFKEEKKIILFIFLTLLLISFIYAFLATPWYKAEVKVMPNFGETNPILSQYSSVANLAGININAPNLGGFDYYPDIIRSNYVLEHLLKRKYKNKTFKKDISLFQFWKLKVDTTNPNLLHKLVEEGKKKLRKDYIHPLLNQETDLLTVVVTVPKDPVLAAELANNLLIELDNYNKNFRHYKARDQRVFIEKSLQETKKNLGHAEKKLKEFLNENKDLKAPEKKLEYEKLSNELNLQRTLYNELKKQLEIAKIEEVKQTETLNILEKAVVPIERYKPKRAFILIISFILATILSIFYVIIKNYYLYFSNKLKK